MEHTAHACLLGESDSVRARVKGKGKTGNKQVLLSKGIAVRLSPGNQQVHARVEVEGYKLRFADHVYAGGRNETLVFELVLASARKRILLFSISLIFPVLMFISLLT